MSVLTKLNPKNRKNLNTRVLNDSAIKKAAKLSISDQRKLSKQAEKLRTQTAIR